MEASIEASAEAKIETSIEASIEASIETSAEASIRPRQGSIEARYRSIKQARGKSRRSEEQVSKGRGANLEEGSIES